MDYLGTKKRSPAVIETNLCATFDRTNMFEHTEQVVEVLLLLTVFTHPISSSIIPLSILDWTSDNMSFVD